MNAPPLWAVDLALGAVAFETLGLIAYRRFRGGGAEGEVDGPKGRRVHGSTLPAIERVVDVSRRW
ncbi:MAG: hypothetical protein AAF645_23560, partial [Myxococcota bacterium]